MKQFFYLLKQAWKSLQLKLGLVFSVVSTMSFTLGTLLCVSTLAYVMLFKPLPYTDQAMLYKVQHLLLDNNEVNNGDKFNYPGLMHLYKSQQVFSHAALVYYDKKILTSHPAQPTISTSYVTPQWFSLFNMKMLLGRQFDSSEGVGSDVPLAILSYDMWQQVFAADANILNKTVRFRDINFKVIGVSAPSFIEPQLLKSGLRTQAWLSWEQNDFDAQDRLNFELSSDNLMFVGKLTSADDLTSVAHGLTSLVNSTWQEGIQAVDFYKGWQVNVKLQPLKEVIIGNKSQSIFLLLAGVVGLTLIASANIANLFIARMADQQRQLAISAAVGAKKSDLFKIVLAETGLLMFFSIILALCISYLGFIILQQNLTAVFPRVDELSINGITLTLASLLVICLAFALSALSCKTLRYKSLATMLHTSGKGVGTQVSSTVRKLLVTSQVAVATVLIFISISLFKDAIDVIYTPVGINTDNFIDIRFSTARAPTQEEINGPVLGTAIRNQIALLPQVDAVSSSPSPLSGFRMRSLTDLKTDRHMSPEVNWVDEKYFQLIEQPLIEGDYFTTRDIREGFTAPEGKVDTMVLIINDVLAEHLAPNSSALGLQVRIGVEHVYTIIGVVKGVLLPGTKTIPFRAYMPASVHSISMVIKLKPDQSISREEIVKSVDQVTSLFALFSMESVSHIQQKLLFTQIVTAITTGVLAILTILLSAVGLYGILHYNIQMRRFEFGTRMAIGARRMQILRLTIKDNVNAILLGMLIGSVILSCLGIIFYQYVFQQLTIQLVPLFMISLVLICFISFLACYIPLRSLINRPVIHSLCGNE